MVAIGCTVVEMSMKLWCGADGCTASDFPIYPTTPVGTLDTAFLLFGQYACAIQHKDKLTILNLSAPCEEASRSNKSPSHLQQGLLLSPPSCCVAALYWSLTSKTGPQSNQKRQLSVVFILLHVAPMAMVTAAFLHAFSARPTPVWQSTRK